MYLLKVYNVHSSGPGYHRYARMRGVLATESFPVEINAVFAHETILLPPKPNSQLM